MSGISSQSIMKRKRMTMENKELIKNVTYNESGCERPLEESVISFLQILIPKPTTPDAKDDEVLSYKNCNSFELIYDIRMPQILYYLGDYMFDADAKPSRFFNPLIFDGTTVGDSGDLTESYKACEAIKKWAENTMELIDRKRYETFSCEMARQIKNKAQNNENN